MDNVIDLNNRREIDPLTSPEVKKLVSIWHTGHIGGAERISHCIRGAFVGDQSDDAFKLIRNGQPKLLLVFHPVVAAWSRDETCNIKYGLQAGPQRKRGVLMEWLDTLCEENIICSEIRNGVVVYVPTRDMLYKMLDGMTFLFNFFDQLYEEVPVAIELLKNTQGNPWVSDDTPIPKETINETPR